jgi:hypothetical protein
MFRDPNVLAVFVERGRCRQAFGATPHRPGEVLQLIREVLQLIREEELADALDPRIDVGLQTSVVVRAPVYSCRTQRSSHVSVVSASDSYCVRCLPRRSRSRQTRANACEKIVASFSMPFIKSHGSA